MNLLSFLTSPIFPPPHFALRLTGNFHMVNCFGNAKCFGKPKTRVFAKGEIVNRVHEFSQQLEVTLSSCAVPTRAVLVFAGITVVGFAVELGRGTQAGG